MPTPPSTLSSHNVQTIVPREIHKALTDEAYSKNIPLKDLIREILVKHCADQETSL